MNRRVLWNWSLAFELRSLVPFLFLLVASRKRHAKGSLELGAMFIFFMDLRRRLGLKSVQTSGAGRVRTEFVFAFVVIFFGSGTG